MFKLVRYFSISSFITMLIAVLLLGELYHSFATEDLIKLTENKNVTLSRSLSNIIWTKHNYLFTSLQDQDAETVKKQIAKSNLQQIVNQYANNTDIIKIKIYLPNGLTVFSTDITQIGKVKTNSEGIDNALSGKTSSYLGFRDSFYAIKEKLKDINAISSYIPITVEGEVKGIFELYADVTELTLSIENTRRKIITGTALIFVGIYFILFLIIRIADKILKEQDAIFKKQAEVISFHAYHDALTSLPNRTYFKELLSQSMSKAERNEKMVGLMFIDLDRFKTINDSLGHHVGDQLLKTVAQRLRECVRESDIVARLGGDEFTVILPDLESVETTSNIAQRIIDAFDQPVDLEKRSIVVTTSIGIAFYPFDDTDIDKLINAADAAMFRVKEKGRNGFQYYTSDMNDRAMERLEMESDLRAAIANDEFFVMYQPRVNLQTGEISGAEALIRWNHPDKGLISPADFIPVAEDSGLIVPIGEWVLEHACRQMVEWQNNYKPLHIAINLSARQFQQNELTSNIYEILNRTGFERRYLELEITESVLLTDVVRCIEILRSLKDMDIQIAIDDFGTGYSSLNYLKQFPIDILKIDRCFIDDIINDKDDVAIVKTVVTLAENLGLSVVAEGVETREQCKLIRELGCDEIQGYYFSKPLSKEEFEIMLRENHKLDISNGQMNINRA